MGATREGEKVYIHPSTLSTRYGQLTQGLDVNNKAKFNKVGADGSTTIGVNNLEVTEQNPIPSNQDSIYVSDLDIPNCDNGNFSGEVSDYFNSLKKLSTDVTTNNPKTIKLWFKRSVQVNQIGFGCDDLSSGFKNIKIMALGSGEAVRYTKDLSTDSTKRNSYLVELKPLAVNGFLIEFHTTDEICLSNLIIFKVNDVNARIKAIDTTTGEVKSIASHLSLDGGYHLATSMIQDIFIDSSNSSTTNLDSGNSYTFTGTATRTTSVGAIQFLLRTNQNAIVYVDQSSDGTEWDITDSYNYFYSKGGTGRTLKTVGEYFRVRVILTLTNPTTFFRLETKLIPVSEPLPRSLDSVGRLKTTSGIIDTETQTRASVDPLGALKTIIPVRLVGTAFNNGTKDPNFWTETVTGSGAVTQAGQITLSTGTTANSTAAYYSVRSARKVTGTANQFRATGRLVTDPQANNYRRIGARSPTDGFFFEATGTTFSVVSRKSSVDTRVSSGSFNGNYGTDVLLDTTTVRTYVIEYTSITAKFYVDGILLHSLKNPTNILTNTLTFPIMMENINFNGNTTDNIFNIRFATILRLGQLETNPQFRFVNTNGTFTLKYNAGTLQRIINCDNTGSVLIYDNITASGTLIASIDTIKTLGTLDFGAPFSTGLTIVNSGARICVIYE